MKGLSKQFMFAILRKELNKRNFDEVYSFFLKKCDEKGIQDVYDQTPLLVEYNSLTDTYEFYFYGICNIPEENTTQLK